MPAKQARRKELEAKMGETSFWDHQDTAKSVVAEMKILKAAIEDLSSRIIAIRDSL